jgi:hypothetical protein
MGADLVGTPGEGACFYQGNFPIILEELKPGDRWFALARISNCALAPADLTPEREVDYLCRPVQVSTNQRVVAFCDPVISKLFRQAAVRGCRARQNEHSAGFFIQAVCDPQPPPIRFQYLADVVQGWIVSIREAQQSGWFIDHQQIIILP